MAAYTNFTDFLPYVMNEVPGCPRPVATEFVRKFAIRLCEKAFIIKKEASEIMISADVAKYSLNFTENLYRPVGIVYAQYQSGAQMDSTSEAKLSDRAPNWRTLTTSQRPNHYFLTLDDKLQVYPKPTTDLTDPIDVECYVAPIRTASKIDTYVFNTYAETIAYGALSELQLMPDQSWSNETLAALNARNWRMGLRNAGAHSVRGKDGRQKAEVYPQSFEVFGS